ncbi:L,D-transpeptidase [Thioclava sp. GXIMD4216]|uniref:L,D-transpeptidase n=1 Tax=Thioclava litoralis TaxID=3076557 RepID=A0ABZ1E0R5_9RHOB|nr:L,D-transpeptidase [Thioclava sp. FTW29]
MSSLFVRFRLPMIAAAGLVALAGCAAQPHTDSPSTRISTASVPAEYRARQDELEPDVTVPAINPRYLTERNRRQWVDYNGPEAVGTIVVDPYARVAYHIVAPGRAMRMGVAVGKAGKGFSGTAVIRRKEVYPSWTPTKNMIRNDPDLYGPLSGGLKGGLENPLGARALYLYKNGRDTYYRLHGTMDPSSIGKATSAGCIRFFNQDIMDMFDETDLGTVVKVRSKAESLKMEGPMTELHSGYVVPSSDTAAIEADAKAWDEGKIEDPAISDKEAHDRAVAAAKAQASGGDPVAAAEAAEKADEAIYPAAMTDAEREAALSGN